MSHWNDRKDWKLIDEPLRPTDTDIKIFKQFRNKYIFDDAEILVLGYTERLVFNEWQREDYVTVVDHSPSILDGKIPVSDHISYILDNWVGMKFKYNRFNYVVGDSSIACIPFSQWNELLANIHSLMTPKSFLAMRFFLPPKINSYQVLTAFKNYEIDNFHDFKRQLMCSLIDSENMVIMHDVWKAFHTLSDHSIKDVFIVKDWHPNLLETIESFKDKTETYTFPNLDTIVKQFVKYFDVASIKGEEEYPVILFERI